LAFEGPEGVPGPPRAAKLVVREEDAAPPPCSGERKKSVTFSIPSGPDRAMFVGIALPVKLRIRGGVTARMEKERKEEEGGWSMEEEEEGRRGERSA